MKQYKLSLALLLGLGMFVSCGEKLELVKGHKTKCNKMEDDRKRLYMLIFNQLERN